MNNIKVHPIYNNYGYDPITNNIIFISKNRIVKQRLHHSGYTRTSVSNDHTQKSYGCHRFIWECCNDVIPKGYEIDHINKIKTDNNISNLRCVTVSENRKNRDHTQINKISSNAHSLVKYIKAINKDTDDFLCFKSKMQCAKYLRISPAMIYLIIEKKNYAKYANTKNGKYYFNYIDENDVTNLINIEDKRKRYK